jgi:hypothetical protein
MDNLDLILHRATLPDGSLEQVAIKDGHIKAIMPLSVTLGTAKTVLDLQGDLL